MKQKKRRHVPDVGASSGPRTVGIEDLMTSPVMTTTRHQTVGRVREVLTHHGIHSMPVVTSDGSTEGIVTSTDLLDDVSDETKVGAVMTRDVYTVPRYAGLHVAARIMRNHRIHHLVVEDEGKVVGLLSSFDLLRLVEDKRFVAKNPPSPVARGVGRRTRSELRPED